ncbi:hypothetical protein MLD38_005386 [Melastoma candidum]|uniref:Uncharacterized protein n=1 Tax=Melastoma candidum TaxID=119954 RepID=A0ACB9S8P7_9MYRT|nr:hypothetical protein MLD38_005386 [Melastoma candidum]
MNLWHDTRLPVLACIHTPDNISSIIRIIDSSQSAESTVSVYIPHLVNCTEKQNRVVRNKSYSDNVILAFTSYAWGFLRDGPVQHVQTRLTTEAHARGHMLPCARRDCVPDITPLP